MKCMKAVKNKKRKKFLSKRIILVFLMTWILFPVLKGQETGTFLRFQSQFPIALSVVIPDWINTKKQRLNIPHFFQIKTPHQWRSVTVPSPDRSPRIYNYHEIGIFCKLDVKLDKISKLPIRFRLGTQEAVDRKEGKY